MKEKKKKVCLKQRECAILGKKGKEMQQPCERKKKKVYLKHRERAVLGKKVKEMQKTYKGKYYPFFNGSIL